MNDYVSLIINALLFLSVSAVLAIYIKKALEANKEYSKAKDLVEGVILSFNREIQGLNQKIDQVDVKIQNTQLLDIDQIKLELASKIERLQDLYSTLENKIESLRVKIEKMSEKANRQEISFEEQEKPRLPARSAIPLKRERALAPLTPTELKVLEILSVEGDKTVREIRNRIGLTREHTGRLMKSLYDKGYVERRTDRIPYVYRIKKEMENLLSNQNQ